MLCAYDKESKQDLTRMSNKYNAMFEQNFNEGIVCASFNYGKLTKIKEKYKISTTCILFIFNKEVQCIVDSNTIDSVDSSYDTLCALVDSMPKYKLYKQTYEPSLYISTDNSAKLKEFYQNIAKGSASPNLS